MVRFRPWPPLNQGFRAIGSTLDVEYRSDCGISGRSQFLLVRISVASRYPPRHPAPVAVKGERQFRGELENSAKLALKPRSRGEAVGPVRRSG